MLYLDPQRPVQNDSQFVFLSTCFYWPDCQHESVGLGNNWQQPITWTNADPVPRIYASSHHTVLTTLHWNIAMIFMWNGLLYINFGSKAIVEILYQHRPSNSHPDTFKESLAKCANVLHDFASSNRRTYQIFSDKIASLDVVYTQNVTSYIVPLFHDYDHRRRAWLLQMP